jgi:hypothetical protein
MVTLYKMKPLRFISIDNDRFNTPCSASWFFLWRSLRQGLSLVSFLYLMTVSKASRLRALPKVRRLALASDSLSSLDPDPSIQAL